MVQTYAQHRAQQRSRLWLMWPVKIACAIGLLALAALGVYAKLYFIVAFAVFFLLLLAAGPRFDYLMMRRRWKRHPQFNELLRVELSEDHVSHVTSKFSGTTQWSGYVKGIAHSTGVMLYSSSWEYYWLPDSAITSGTPADARKILESKLRDFSVV